MEYHMKLLPIVGAVVIGISLFAGQPVFADDFDITFKFERKHKCSANSLKITLSNIPEGTQEFQVALKDHDAMGWNHGGGTVSNDGSGVIAEGALTEGYNGPCPPSSHLYEIIVRALDANDKELAEAGKKRMFS